MVFIKIKRAFFLTQVLSLLIFSVPVLLSFFGYRVLHDKWILNTGILGIFVSSQISSILPFLLDFLNCKKKYFQVTILLGFIGLAILLLFITNSRSSWIGLLAALIALAYLSDVHKVIKKISIFSPFLFICVSFLFAFSFKVKSSAGRVFIYKISSKIFKDNWVTGIGIGKYKVLHNEYQASYFSRNSIDSKEAILADNTYYAFNEIWQLLIELGLLKFVLVVFGFSMLIKFLVQFVPSQENRSLYSAGLSSLVCVFAASLFSYPFHSVPIVLQVLLCCIVVVHVVANEYNSNKALASVAKYLRALFLICFFIVGYFGLSSLVRKNEVEVAINMGKAGNHQKAIQEFHSLYIKHSLDGLATFEYARELYHSNMLDEAKQVILKAKQSYVSNELYRILARIEEELKNVKDAERNYKWAVYMVPNRMVSRFDLMNFYVRQNDTTNAIYWAKSIINMPVKIPSNITEHLKKQANGVVKSLE